MFHLVFSHYITRGHFDHGPHVTLTNCLLGHGANAVTPRVIFKTVCIIPFEQPTTTNRAIWPVFLSALHILLTSLQLSQTAEKCAFRLMDIK